MRAARNTTVLFSALTALLGLAGPAGAEPQLEIGLNALTTPITREDERLAYQVEIENTADAQPVVGTELTCQTSEWIGTVSVEWLRDGAPIGGATESTYTLTAEDQGKAIQCVAQGINGSAGVKHASLPPLTVAPEPSPAPPKGLSPPKLSLVVAAAPTGTATTTAGSNVLTNVITAEGTADTEAGSKFIKDVNTATGTFLTGQVLTGPGISAEATGDLTEGSRIVTDVKVSSGALAKAQRIFGAGIAQNTLIEKVIGPDTIELLKAVEPGKSGNDVAINAGPEVNMVKPGEIELSAVAGATASDVAIAGGGLPFSKGQTISGAGIPPGTTIAGETNGQRVTLSNAATASASGVAISGTSTLTCTAPTGWSGNGLTWSLQWLKNGEPIPGETGAEYTVKPADVPSILQCEAVAEDSEGRKAVLISTHKPTLPDPEDSVPAVSLPPLTFSNEATGLVEVDAEVPGSIDTYALRVFGNGWDCTKTLPAPGQPATAHCSTEEPLPPQDSYPPIQLYVALGEDAPKQLVTKASVSGGGSLPDSTEDTVPYEAPGPGFGFQAFEAGVFDELGEDHTQAGGHPYSAKASFKFNEHMRAEVTAETGLRAASGLARTIVTDTPRGFVGSAEAVPVKCQNVAEVIAGTCPAGSVVGGLDLDLSQGLFLNRPLYVIEPEFGTAAQFAFSVTESSNSPAYTLSPELRADDGYAITLFSAPIVKFPQIFGGEATICGFGAKFDSAKKEFAGCKGPNEAGANEQALLTNPTRCAGQPPTTRMQADSWEDPGKFVKAEFSSPALTGCDEVDFEPEINFTPLSNRADSATGLDVELTMPTEGLKEPEGVSQATLKRVKVTMPEGMAINASSGHGLGACNPAQIKLRTNDPISCPESSKVASVEVDSPLLGESVNGEIYVASQGSIQGAPIGFYMVLDSKRYGVLVKVPATVRPNPVTGQLTVTFDESPELPFEAVRVHFGQSTRAPLMTPPRCGTYKIKAELSPWTATDPDAPTTQETVTRTSTFKVSRGPGGGACPTGALEPKLLAGSANPLAGRTSAFNLRLHRDDGTDRFRSLTMKPPLGLTAYLRGVPYCPDSAIASISSELETGRDEIESPTCPAASQIGTVSAGAGAGPNPFYVNTGKAYLAGPYKGAPASILVVAPAVAGPLDLGSVAVRNAVHIDPATAQITVVSDPIPTIIHGLLPDIRDVRVAVDRPDFTLNPTSCEEKAIDVTVGGEAGGNAALTNRFQVGGCENLGFKPRLRLSLKGGTRRGAYQGVRAVLRPRPGDANISSTSVRFPRSAFVAQEHIRTICTRVQWAQDACPKGSIYGTALAYTPLLDSPLRGKVYLRSSDNELPDAVADLRGPAHQPIRVEVAVRNDSVGGALRNTVTAAPDAPVSYFRLDLFGGRRGLIVNSRDLCGGKQRATVEMGAHNGMEQTLRPVVRNENCANGKAKKRKDTAKRSRG